MEELCLGHPPRGGGHSLIKVKALRLLPKAVQQLKMLPRADTIISFFDTLERTRHLILIALEWTTEKNVT